MDERTFELRGNERFTIRRRLGAGAMGVVYEALDRDRGEPVAIKTLRYLDASALYRLKQEFRGLQNLEHRNLVRLGELIEDGGEWFFSMELVEGVDLLTYVRPPQPNAPVVASASPSVPPAQGNPTEPRASTPETTYDEQRLRAAMQQLALGLYALHGAGKVHRDVKPSNARVTPEDRVVLLDFGLTTDIEEGDEVAGMTTGGNVVGTPAYMSPEQAASRPVGPEADWYATGIVLYEALTGTLPFGGSKLQILMDKQRHEPPPPRARNPDIPPDLDALCSDLLRREPEDRPTGREVLQRLGAGPVQVPALGTLSSHGSSRAVFVGRDAELAKLRRAFATARAGQSVTVRIRGESGVGKSALTRTFTTALEHLAPELVLLHGKCSERELVPFNALDGIVDELSRYLRHGDEVEVNSVVPNNAALLCRVFPILSRVPAIAGSPTPMREIRDPHELRRRAFNALRDMLARIAERRPVVAVIDDMHWADADSELLLTELRRPPDAPGVLWLLTERPVEALRRRVEVAGLSRAGHSQHTHLIELQPLDPEAAEELARRLLPRGQLDNTTAQSIATEARGHPMYIDELARHITLSGESGDGASARPQLDEAIALRAEALAPDTRRVLELLVTAGAALSREVIRVAGQQEPTAFQRSLSQLRVAHLVRTSGQRRADTLELYHDRVRVAVAGTMDDASRKRCHRRLARALEGSPVARDRPELLLRHLEAAGNLTKAAGYAEYAAEAAVRALAFDRAADLYRAALRIGDYDPESARKLASLLGDTLANAGRLYEAADVYLDATADADRATSFELRRRALEQLLRVGDLVRGLELSRVVLGEVGIELPRTYRRTLLSIVLRRLWLRLRGTRFEPRPPAQVLAEDLHRLDVCWSVCTGLSFVDPFLGNSVQLAYLLAAMRAGDRDRAALAMAIAVGFTSTEGTKVRTKVDRLVGDAKQLAHESGNPRTIAFADSMHGLALFLRGDFNQCREPLTSSRASLLELPGTRWETTMNYLYDLSAMAYLGHMKELAKMVPRLMAEAESRGDAYLLRGVRAWRSNVAWLAQDEPELAREQVVRASERDSGSTFHLHHYFQLHAHAQIDLYAGEAEQAWNRMAETWPKLKRSMLLRVQSVRVEAHYLRARCAVALASERPSSERAELLREATKAAKQLRAEHAQWSTGFAHLIGAACARLSERPEQAAEPLRSAAGAFASCGMAVLAAVARTHLATLTGRPDHTDAVGLFQREEIQNPARLAAMYAPGFD